MSKFLNLIRRTELKFDSAAEHFFWRHPLVGYISIFIGMPIAVLVAVFVCTVAISFPIAWFFGWL